jgi:Fur family peroxide stress response transcriptional regulator
MIANLRTQGHRLTPQRMAILKILAQSKSHPSAEAIYDSVQTDFPMTSLATVYKTVTVLKEIGEILELGFSDDSNHYDGNQPQPHPHLVCVRCKSIEDLDVDPVDALADQVSRKTGYRLVEHRLDFFGICPECQRKSTEIADTPG